MNAILAIFIILSIILLLGMIGDKDSQNRKNYTYAFCTLVIAIVVIAFKII